MILQGSRVIARLSNFSSQCLDKRLSLAWNISRVSTQHRPCPEGHGAICTFKPTLSTSLPYRPYATNATNAVSRPKAHTGRTTSAPRKKAATTKALTSGSTAAGTEPAAKKPAAKKPAAKKPTAKKKARRGPKKSKSRTRAKSTKAPKKPAKAKKSKLTPEQEKEQKRRSEIKNLKAKALTPPKGLPSTAYIVFNTEKYKNTRTRIDQGAAKECSAQYRSFSPEEREVWRTL